MPDVKVVTFNVRGLRNMTKRRTIFRFLHQCYPSHIVVLQETHSAPGDNTIWQNEWGAPIVFSHGISTSECGIAILLPRVLCGTCDVKVMYIDDVGRLLILELKFRLCRLLLCGVYAPTQSHGQLQVEFIASVREELNRLVDGDPYLIVCGDFNIHLSELDTLNRFRLTRAASEWRVIERIELG